MDESKNETATYYVNLESYLNILPDKFDVVIKGVKVGTGEFVKNGMAKIRVEVGTEMGGIFKDTNKDLVDMDDLSISIQKR